MTLLSSLLVRGATSGLSKGASAATSRALGSAVSKALSTGGYGAAGGGYSSGATQAALDRLGYKVEGVDVTKTPPPPSATPVGAGVASAIANGAIPAPANTVSEAVVTRENAPSAQNEAVNAAAAAAGAELAGAAPTTVDELEVVASRPPPPPRVEAAPLITSGIQNLLTMGSPNLTPASEVTEPAKDPLDVGAVAAVAPFAALGLIPTGSTLPAAGAIKPPGEGILGTGVGVKDLVAPALLAGSLAAGSGGTGSAGKALEGIAENNKNLANRLGNIADAGMRGDIGGKGLNSISRMVRKAQAAIRQRYAAMGMSGSTAEQDDLNDAVEAGVEQQFKIGQQMAQTGLNAIAALTGQSAQAYLALLNANTAKNTALGNTLANFAAAIAK